MKKTAQKVALLAVSLLVSFLFIEGAWRVMLESDSKTGRKLRIPRLYADPFSDELFWLLRYQWRGKAGRLPLPQHPHPLLGWRNAHVGADYSHVDAKRLHGHRRPVLLYGDSFAQGTKGASRFQDILAHEPSFAQDHFLINYGVAGYGVDQIALLFEQSVDRYEDPFVIFSVMTFDLDRSILPVRISQKPYFELVRGELELRGVPIPEDPHDYFRQNAPFVGSYVLRRLSRLPMIAGDEEKRPSTAKKKAINGAILGRVIDGLESRELDYVIFVFHARKAFREGLDWRSEFLRDQLEEREAPYLWSYDILKNGAPGAPIDELFDAKNVHPTSVANRIMAEAMADWVLRESGRLADPG